MTEYSWNIFYEIEKIGLMHDRIIVSNSNVIARWYRHYAGSRRLAQLAQKRKEMTKDTFDADPYIEPPNRRTRISLWLCGMGLRKCRTCRTKRKVIG